MITVILAVALASPQFAMSHGQPRIQATACDALYYGLGRSRDLAGAYRCYGTDGDFAMQIIMAFNGEGTIRNRRRVEQLFDTWERRAPGEALSGYADSLRVALGSLRAGTTVQRLVFCEHVASGTQDGMRCDSIRQFILNADAKRSLDRIGAALSSEQKTAFETLRAAFARFAAAENYRGLQLFIKGTIRNSAGAVQEDYVREHFIKHAKDVVGARSLESATDAHLQSAVAALAMTYQKDLMDGEDGERGAIGVGAGYKTVTEGARQAWDEYRRAWMAMVVTLPIADMPASVKSRSIDSLLTLERIDELQHNILGIR